MKKILLLAFVALFAFTGCKKEGKDIDCTVNAHIKYVYEQGGQSYLADNILILLYDYEVAKDFDSEKTQKSIRDNYKITLKNGTTQSPKYREHTTIGSLTINNVKKGKYIAFIYWKPEGFDIGWMSIWYMGYKEADFQREYNSLDACFTWGEYWKLIKF
jgi:hypothetical protein